MEIKELKKISRTCLIICCALIGFLVFTPILFTGLELGLAIAATVGGIMACTQISAYCQGMQKVMIKQKVDPDLLPTRKVVPEQDIQKPAPTMTARK